MQKIVPFLWFDNQVEEAVELYTSVFDNSGVLDIARYGGAGPGPEGSVMTMTFQLEGQEFMGLNGGPVFRFTPSTSFFVRCDTLQKVDRYWQGLSEGGTVLMALDQYPFSERYGWIQDRFGVSWQLIFAGQAEIAPLLMFAGKQHGKAEEAMRFYTRVFQNSGISRLERYGPEVEDREGAVVHAEFQLDGQEFLAMDGGVEQASTFTPAMSFFVHCDNQQQIDALWENLSDGGEPGQCGWLEDRYGVSWQIVPTVLGKLMQDEDRERATRVTKAMLQMTKLDIAALQHAYDRD